ncbi:hypothetical protein [Tenacibaculum geojense]|uniref:Uncharacterized protein n=1 Tax=Tenacibaculum geojense TaxID=915352 RepID=A0ABW3JQV0_9FLAO
MLRVYHRVKINPELLNPDLIEIDEDNFLNPFAKYLSGSEKTTIPAGKVVGVTWNPYVIVEPQTSGSPFPSESESIGRLPAMALPNSRWSQTDISMYDSKSQEITATTDISDYRHKSGGHIDGFKNIHMSNTADTLLKIVWKTLGNTPICGEFVFIIEQENCEC